MRARQQILAIAPSIIDNQTLTIKCMFCMEDYENQGRPHDWKPEKSLSITREGYALLYHCFRASCTRGHGVVHILDGLHKSALDKRQAQTKKFIPKFYPYRTIPAKVIHLKGSSELTQEELEEQHVRYAPDRETVVYPIYDSVGHEVGVVDRSYSGRSPKAISYWFNDVPKMHYPIEDKTTRTCMIVEDIPSAIRASPWITTVALLGTNLTSDCLMELRDRFDVLLIALDEDATAKAIQMSKQFTLYFKEVHPVVLDKDIKNMKDHELDKLIQRLI